MLRKWMLLGGLASALCLAACGGAEVEADDDPGTGESDFEAETHGDLTEPSVGADVEAGDDSDD